MPGLRWTRLAPLCAVLACRGASDVDDDAGVDTGLATDAGSDGDMDDDAGDGASTSDGADESGDESSGGHVEVDCTEACADLDSDAGVAVCYACRCKNAMDGFLPSVDEVQCSEAEPLTIYTADLSGAEAQLVPLTEDRDTCVNPSLLYEVCHPGSRLGQMQVGTVFVKWICRDPDASGALFNDVGVIMHNTRNGASCWFDDVDGVTGMDDLPDLDLMEAGQANLDDYLDKFYFTDGETCTASCHDADPFVYTPYFQGIEWQTGPYVASPHGRVELDGTLGGVDATHLVSPEVAPCRSCHRVGSAAGCDFLTPDALGTFKTPAHEQSVVDAMADDSADWKLAYWMPDALASIATLAAWQALYGAARDRIEECCAAPGVSTPACAWEPVPPPP